MGRTGHLSRRAGGGRRARAAHRRPAGAHRLGRATRAGAGQAGGDGQRRRRRVGAGAGGGGRGEGTDLTRWGLRLGEGHIQFRLAGEGADHRAGAGFEFFGLVTGFGHKSQNKG